MKASPINRKLRLSLLESDIQALSSEISGVEVRLERLLKRDLTFKGEKTTYASHNIHAFAAKFPPQLPRLFIRELTSPNQWVLDPMAGSGTTLVEAILSDRNGIGIDLDPLAVRISRVKSDPPDLNRCFDVGIKVLKRANLDLNSFADDDLSKRYLPKAVEFFNYWFEKRTIAEIYVLVRSIRRVDDPQLRCFLEVILSSIIITKTGGITRARDLAHTRLHRDSKKKVTQSAFDAFRDRLAKAIEGLQPVSEAFGRAVTTQSDARDLPLPDDSVDLIVTSPPYAANAIDYMRAHKFSLMWSG